MTDEYTRVQIPSLTKARADDNDPIDQKSRVTAFINTEEGMKVECWEIGGLLPHNQVTRADGSEATVRQKNEALSRSVMPSYTPVDTVIHCFPPNTQLLKIDLNGVHSNVIDFMDNDFMGKAK